MGTLLDELMGDDEPESEWLPPNADGTQHAAAIPFSGLFDGPEIPAPAY